MDLKPAGLGLALLLAAVPSPASARPATYAMSCASAAGLVARHGGIVLDTSPTTFDRYVSDLRFCMPGQALRPEWVRSRDVRQCFIGYTCYDPDRGSWRWGW